jgi:SHAQKYF class myb-like DNA-binding protein
MALTFFASEQDADMVDTSSEIFVPAVDPIQHFQQSPRALDTQASDSIQVCSSALRKKGESGSTPHRKSRGQSAAHKGRKYSDISTSGRWTAEEHNAFLRGLKIFGREWKKVVTCIPTRTSAQIRSHAQKYFAKQSKEMQRYFTSDEDQRSPILRDTQSRSDQTEALGDHSTSKSFNEVMKSIASDPSLIEVRVCSTLASLRLRHKALEERLSLRKLPVQTENVAVGPATAALEQEQKSLRKAAEARHEIKQRQHKSAKLHTTPEVEATSCALVSLASMRSYGGFDSSDVIALSMLGGNLGKEGRLTWNTERSSSGHE